MQRTTMPNNDALNGGPRQIEPSIVVDINNGDARHGNIYSPGTTSIQINGTTAAPWKEYWYLDSLILGRIMDGKSFNMTTSPATRGKNYTPPAGAASTPLYIDENTAWEQVTSWTPAATAQNSIVYSSTSGVYLQFIWDKATLRICEVSWYQPSPPSTYIDPAGTYALSTDPFPTGTWYVSRRLPLYARCILSKLGTYYLGISPSTSPPSSGALVSLQSTPTLWLFDSQTGLIKLASDPSLVLQGSDTQGTQLIVATVSDTPSDYQQWAFPVGGYGMLTNAGSTLVVDDYNSETGNGTVIQMYSPDQGPNQFWKLV